MTGTNPHLPDQHLEIKPSTVAVLLVNLGTPSACDTSSVRRFLAEFLSDRRVIELSPLLWKPILYSIILTTRPIKITKAYQKIWLQENNESPLLFYTRQQARKLGHALQSEPNILVDWAMRYGEPSLQSTLEKLKQQGCQRLLVVPLYPQFSATSTASVIDKVFDVLKTWRWQPALRTLPPYFDHPAYISALAETVQQYLDTTEKKPEVILASYHGIPKDCVKQGDPYYCHCSKTTRLLREKLEIDDAFLQMTFQSRFGPKKWLEPATNLTLKKLAKQGIKHIAIITPGFASDCLETLEEMDIQNRETFINNGGSDYDVIPCLNDSQIGINMLETIVRQELKGWEIS
ncbi:MAG: ferrochelatase [Methylococcales bacterium]